MIGINVFAADSDVAGQRLMTSAQQAFLNLIRGMPGELPAPVENMTGRWSAAEQVHVEQRLRVSAVGSPQRVRSTLEKWISDTQADEVILTGQIFDHAARLALVRDCGIGDE